jgi:hypothetical protein
MGILLALTIFAGMDLYFLKDSSDFLVRIIPETETEQINLYYSFSGSYWDSVSVKRRGQFFDAVITPPAHFDIVGCYAVDDSGNVDDNDGGLYLYEVKMSPRMIMPISLADLETMLNRARQKITANTDVDEAIQLLDYVENTLVFIPFIRGAPSELKRNTLYIEVNNLRKQLSQ